MTINQKQSIPGWPFPVYGAVSETTRKMISPSTQMQKMVQSIQKLQKAKAELHMKRLKKFDDDMNALL